LEMLDFSEKDGLTQLYVKWQLSWFSQSA